MNQRVMKNAAGGLAKRVGAREDIERINITNNDRKSEKNRRV